MTVTIVTPRYRELVLDRHEWTMHDIARELDMGVQTVRGWFRNSLQGQEVEADGGANPSQVVRNWLRVATHDETLIDRLLDTPAHPEALPAPLKVVNRVPKWRAGEVRRWAMQTGRMTAEGQPMLRRSKPGRRTAEAPRVDVAVPDGTLLTDQTAWDIPRIAVELGVARPTVKTWRYKQLLIERGEAGPETVDLPFPKPIPDMGLTGKPLWRAGEVRRWAMQTGRMTFKGEPRRPKSPGRPRATAYPVGSGKAA